MKGCPSCGRMIDQNNEICPYCNYNFENLNKVFKKYEEAKKITVPKYAGFIKRTVATGIDTFIFSIIFTFLNAVYLFAISPSLTQPQTEAEIVKLIWPLLTMPIFYFIYCVFMQCSKNMGTLGEKLLKIEVVDLEDIPITFKQSFLRNLARLLNVLTLGIGYIIIIFTKQKQALSDIVTKTTVTNKITNEEYDGVLYANQIVRFIAYIIDMAVLSAIMFGLNYAAAYYALTPKDSELLIQIYTYLPFAIIILELLIIILYFPYLESKKGATIGKMIMGLKVVDYNGNKISFSKALLRYICFILQSSVALSHILCFVTPRRQNLNEIMSKTIVVSKR